MLLHTEQHLINLFLLRVFVMTTVAAIETTDTASKLRDLGFSQYETSCYLSLLASYPANGSQLSKLSGIARSRIYDVLRNMTRKGFVQEAGNGQYVPIPPDELMNRLRAQFESNLTLLEEQLREVKSESDYEYIWAIYGYEYVMKRAIDIIAAAREELYVRLFADAADRLNPHLQAAAERGVHIRYVAMSQMPLTFDIQVIHPHVETLADIIGGRSFDIVADKSEALVGIFETGKEDQSPINWTRSRWFVVANRDSLRHDFYHYFVHKMCDLGEELSARDREIYALIKAES